MLFLQTLVNSLLLGCLYACIGVGFSLVWGVLNVINILHGSLIVLGAYSAWFAYNQLQWPPWFLLPVVAAVFYFAGYVIQRGILNRVIAMPVLLTLTLTFGLDLILNNAMLGLFSADYRQLSLQPALGIWQLGTITVPIDRLLAMAGALLLTGLLSIVLRASAMGRAIVAVRLDAKVALLMGVDVPSTFAKAFGLGAALAGCAGVLLSLAFPFSPLSSTSYLGKAFVVCVLGGLGSVPGALLGGLMLGSIEGFGAIALGSEHATTLSFAVLIVFLLIRPQGILGRRGFE